MNPLAIVLGVALTLAVPPEALGQAKPDFSGDWVFNHGKSTSGTGGNAPLVPFPSELRIAQSATELSLEATSLRQDPLKAVYKLDGSKVTVNAPEGITETAEAKWDGAALTIASRRSFSSPAGEFVLEFSERWTLTGNVLTVEKTRTAEGESNTEKAVFEKK